MEDLDNLVQESLARYFNVLEKTGYINERDTNKLILLTFIQDIINDYPYYITEDDYKVLSNLLSCLYGTSCLIPFAQFKYALEPINNYLVNSPVRVTEDTIIRYSQDENIRLVNQ